MGLNPKPYANPPKTLNPMWGPAVHAKTRIIIFMHNTEHHSALLTRPKAKGKADLVEWGQLEGSVDLVGDMVFDEGSWDSEFQQNAEGIDAIASICTKCASVWPPARAS